MHAKYMITTEIKFDTERMLKRKQDQISHYRLIFLNEIIE